VGFVSAVHNDGGVVAAAAASGASAQEAADEIARKLLGLDLAALLVFVSSDYDAAEFAREIAARFGSAPVVGCTTAGEMTPEGWTDGAVVAIGFKRRDFAMVARPILDLAHFRVEDGRVIAAELRAEMARLAPAAEMEHAFAMLLIDGMCRREEAVISALHRALDDVPIVGGSAGDALRFERTFVIHGGKVYGDAAVLMLFKTRLPIRIFKCDHFEPTPVKMVVTEADSERRIVRELNAEPAAQEYARVSGLADSSLDPFSFASHPVLVGVGGEYYARSIQRVNPDGSLSFFCAIDEGLVFTAARRRDPFACVREVFHRTEAEIGEVEMYIGFECVLRRLDAEREQAAHEMSQLYRANRVVGFNTYGEQYQAMHVNQTFTGVAIGRRREVA
jgi:hypothetical protein